MRKRAEWAFAGIGAAIILFAIASGVETNSRIKMCTDRGGVMFNAGTSAEHCIKVHGRIILEEKP
ncbi:hypothetical protein D3C85_894060 [compost metagenome]